MAATPRGSPSVASFFVSRIDTAVDKLVTERLSQTADDVQRLALANIRGKVAIANAKLAYQRYRRLFTGPRWTALRAKGARPQRLLWASTGTKNPSYSDVLYVEELIGPDTINTMPPATLDAFRNHGRVRASLEEDLPEARQVMAALPIGSASRSTRSLTELSRGYPTVHRCDGETIGRDRPEASTGAPATAGIARFPE